MPTLRDIIESKVEWHRMDAAFKSYQVEDIPDSYDARSVLDACPVPVRN